MLEKHRKGYICYPKSIEYFRNKVNSKDVVVFIDAYYSDNPEEMTKLKKPTLTNDADHVIGSLEIGIKQRGSIYDTSTKT